MVTAQEFVSTQYGDGAEPSTAIIPAEQSQLSRDDLPPAVAQQLSVVRDCFVKAYVSLWTLGDEINKLKREYLRLKGRPLDDEKIAELLGIAVTPQRIGQIANTARYFEDQYRIDGVDFKVYEVARVKNENKKFERWKREPRELYEMISASPTVESVREALEPKDQPPPQRYSFRAAVDWDVSTHRRKEAVSFNGERKPKFEGDEPKWATVSVDSAALALAYASFYAAQVTKSLAEKRAAKGDSDPQLALTEQLQKTIRAVTHRLKESTQIALESIAPKSEVNALAAQLLNELLGKEATQVIGDSPKVEGIAPAQTEMKAEGKSETPSASLAERHRGMIFPEFEEEMEKAKQNSK